MAEPVTLEEMKDFARVDFSDDDTLLTSLGIAAREYVEQATGRTFDETASDKAKTAIKALVAHWYEQRLPADAATGAVQLPFHLRSLIHQLRDWSEPADEEPA